MKKDRYSSKVIVKNTKKINNRERKYCSCIAKVRTKKNLNPYAICTNSLYNRQNLIRSKLINCSKYYNFDRMNYQMLKAYAKEKKIKIYNKGKLLKIVSLYLIISLKVKGNNMIQTNNQR